jgi:PAS domain S-box-containing protein
MRVIATGAAVVLMVLGIFLVLPASLADLNSKVCDLLIRSAGPGTPSGRVVIVAIDERSLAQFGRWPWPRDLAARLSRKVLDQGAAVAAFDMMFPQEDGANDQLLADAISGRPVVAGYALRFDGGDAGSRPCSLQPMPLALIGPGDSRAAFFHATAAVCSTPVVSRAASASGFLNAAPDHDGTMRRIPLVMEYGSRYYPSLSLAAVDLYGHVSRMQLVENSWGASRLRLDNRTIPIEGRSFLDLRFRGPGRTFPYVSAADVLDGRVPGELLRGKIAIIGGSAPGIQNPVVTAVDPIFPDVEIQATAVDDVLQGDIFRRPGDARFWELVIALVAGLISIVLLARTRSLWGALGTLGLGGAVWAGCSAALIIAGVVISPLAALAALACNLPALTLINYLEEKKRADRTQQELSAATNRALEVLRESEARYHRLMENVNDAIIVDDLDGRLVFANRRFREWFGLQEVDIRSVVLEQYVASEWRAEMRDRHDRRMRGEAVPEQFEFEGIRSDGSRIWIEALVTLVKEDGRIAGSQAALRDTTERKRLQAQYLQAQKMETVGRLAGGVAHDFNNLLTVINGYSEMLLGRLPADDRSRQAIEQIHKAGQHAAELTKKLLAFSRKQLVRPKPLDLNVLVLEAEKMFERMIGEDVEMITRLDPDLGTVMADAGQIQQVLMNLLVNARDAMPNGGKLTVQTNNVQVDAANPQVYLGVTDTGAGMSDEVKQRLYEPFFTTKEHGKGTGLGLATVYGIVNQSGGRIDVTSELGLGTTIHIYLPRIKPVLPEDTGASAPAQVSGGSETVLVVEDQDGVREIATTILKSYGYRVLEASNGPDAMALAERYPAAIHLLLTDIILPLMDGRVLADKLREARPGIKVLYTSGYSEERIGESSAVDGDLGYLPKPFTPEMLAARVRETLAGGGSQGRQAPTE